MNRNAYQLIVDSINNLRYKNFPKFQKHPYQKPRLSYMPGTEPTNTLGDPGYDVVTEEVADANLAPIQTPQKILNPPPANNFKDFVSAYSMEKTRDAAQNVKPVMLPEVTIIAKTPNKKGEQSKSSDNLTFSQAFAKARKEYLNGGASTFEWNGKKYGTQLAGETAKRNDKPTEMLKPTLPQLEVSSNTYAPLTRKLKDSKTRQESIEYITDTRFKR